jgi:crotonobetainyl-CoA:carnitine CoA-transferase CaiB-like acyl-CoA transferase
LASGQIAVKTSLNLFSLVQKTRAIDHNCHLSTQILSCGKRLTERLGFLMKQSDRSGPLAGLKVLDLSRVLAGPWATQVLADFGADVWKIENPKGGDDTRKWGEALSSLSTDLSDGTNKPKTSQPLEHKGDVTAYYLSTNRGKHSLSINISTSQGQSIIKALVKKADILVENFKVGNLKKYGLDYESLSKINPKLVYCSITGFGQTGPFAEQPGYDAMIQASAGLMSLTGDKAGKPQKVGVAVSDLMTGMYGVSAILAAIHHRSQTGNGQFIDLALFDTQVSWLANQAMSYLTSGAVPERQGSAHPSIVPYQPFECRDGYMMLAVGNDRQFKRCCEQIGLPELANDECFNSNNQRIDNRLLLIQLMGEQFKNNTTQHWLERLSKANVPCGPINDLSQVFKHPQIKARETLFSLNHPQMGDMPQVANPVKFSKTPINYVKTAPSLGEDTKEVLQKELSFSSIEIEELKKLGVI